MPDSLLRDPPRSSPVPPAAPAARVAASAPAAAPPPTHLRFALLALALGGFAIGTTEFVTMGLLPQIAAGVSISIPTAAPTSASPRWSPPTSRPPGSRRVRSRACCSG